MNSSTPLFCLNADELVIFDASVDNVQQLIEGIKPGIDWVVLNRNQDGIEQISYILANYSEIKTLHIISHGAPGCLFLGNTQLNLETLEGYTTQLQSWFAPPAPQLWGSKPPSPQLWGSKDSQPAIVQSPPCFKTLIYQSPHYWGFGGRDLGAEDLGGKKPSLLLYGCNVAAGDAGEEFINKLHSLTGATIAASSTPVGSIVQGGNWNLDVTTAPLTVESAFQAETLAAYTGLLGGTPIPIGDEFQVNTHTDYSQMDPSVTTLKDGGFVVTWSSWVQDGDSFGVYGQRYNANGSKVGSEFQVNTDTTGDQQYPSVTALNDGGFVVTWQYTNLDRSAGGAYGQRYDVNGNEVGNEFEIDAYSGSWQTAPDSVPLVTDLNDGSFVVVWTSMDEQDLSSYGTYGQRYDANSNKVGDKFKVSDQGGITKSSLTTLSDGSFVVAYIDGNNYVQGKRYNANGTQLGDQFQISSGYYRTWQPSIAALSDGGFIVAWRSYGQDGGSVNTVWDAGVYGQRFDANGSKLGGEFQVNTYIEGGQLRPSVAALNDGGFVVTWESGNAVLDSTQDGSGSGVYGQRYDASGNRVGSEFQVNTYTNDYQDNPSVTALRDGDFVVTWSSMRQDGGGSGVYGQIFYNAFEIDDQSFSIAEDIANGATVGTVVTDNVNRDDLTYSITAGNDSGIFAINASTGEITIADDSQIDFETLPSYNLTVKVSHSINQESASVTVNITDVNDAPEIEAQSFSIAENVSDGATVGTVTANDVDGPTLTYSITAGNNNGIFAIDGITGEITVVDSSQIDFETIPSYNLTVAVNDSEKQTSATVTVNITDVNDAPEIAAQSFEVAEDITDGRSVGTVAALDADGDSLTYSITAGNNNGIFAINASTGEITVVDSSQIDFETTASYNLTVAVNDSATGDSATVTVNISNVNEVPEFTSTAPTNSTQDLAYTYNIVVNDPDAGENLTITAPILPDWLTLTDNGDGTATLRGTPGNDEVGNHTIELQVEDAGGAVDTQSFSVTVNNVNDAPTITGTPNTTVNEDSNYSFVPTGNDIDGDNLSFSIQNKPDWATFDAATGKLSGTPDNEDVGTTENIVISVTDGTETVELDQFSLEVINTNDAPEISSTAPTNSTQDLAYTYNIVVNDPDAGENLTITAPTLPNWLTLTDNGNGTATLRGTPGNNEVGDHDIELRVEDTAGVVNTQSFTVEVKNTNDAPTITGTPNTTVNEDGNYRFVPTAEDIDGDNLSFSIENQPTWATFDAATGKLSGTPTNEDVGTTENIVISVTDGTETVELDQFNLEVVNTNDPPEISSTAPTSSTQGFAYTYNIVIDDPDVGDNLTITAPTLPDWLTLTDNGDGTATLRGTPGNDEVGDHAVELRVEDGDGEVDTQSFTVKVKNTNDAPTIVGTPNTTVDEDSNYRFVPTGNDVDGDGLSFSIENQPDWATFNSATGELSGTPENEDVGTTENIVISVTDGTETVELDQFSLEVINTNDAPEITSVAPTNTAQGSAYTYNIVIDDPDLGDNLTITAPTLPDWLTLTDNGDGTATLRGTPGNDEVGNHTIELQVKDAGGAVDTQSFSVTVNNVNDAPTITGTPNTTVNEDSNYSFVPTGNDVDGDGLSFSIENQPDWATFDAATGKLSGTPENEDVGTTENIVISVTDGTETVELDQFNLEVVNTNDDPEITKTPPTSATQGLVYTYNIEVKDPDAGDNLTITAPTLPDWLTLTDNGDGTATLRGTPGNAEVGNHTIELQVKDAGGAVDTQSFSVTVNNVNDAPTITGTPNTTVNEDGSYSFVPIGNDVDGDSLSFSIQNKPTWSIFNSATGALSGTPDNEDVGTTKNIVIRVTDGTETVALDGFSLEVINTNDAPEINNQSFSIAEDLTNGATVGTVVASDADEDSLTYSITAGNNGGVFTIDENTGEITIADSAQLNFETTESYDLTVAVSDGETGDSATVTVEITNVNEAPTNINLSKASIAENSQRNAIIGTLSTVDPDNPDLHTYTLVDNAENRFKLSGKTLIVDRGNLLDFETDTSHTIRVKTTDKQGLSYEQDLVINVEDGIIKSENELDKYLSDRRVSGVNRILVESIFDVFELGENDPNNTPTATIEWGQQSTVGGDEQLQLSLTGLHSYPYSFTPVLAALGKVPGGLGYFSDIASFLGDLDVSIDLTNPTFTITDLDHAPVYEISAEVEVPEGDHFLGFIKDTLRVDVLTLKAGFNSDNNKPYIVADLDIDDITVFEAGEFSVELSHANLYMETDLKGEPAVSLTPTYTVANYDPTQDNEPKLEAQGLFTFDLKSVTAGLRLKPEDTWKNPFSIPDTEIRDLSLELGATYAGTGFDNVNIIGDLKFGDLDIASAFAVDVNDPEKNAILLTANQPVDLLDLWMGPVTSYTLGTMGEKLTPVQDALSLLDEIVDIQIESIDGDRDGDLDPLIKVVPESKTIGGQTVQTGLAINGKLTAWGAEATLIVKGNPYNLNDMDDTFNAELRIPEIDLGFIKLSGAQDSDLSLEVVDNSNEQYLKGDASLELFGYSVAKADVEVTPSTFTLNDFDVNLGLVALDVDQLSLNPNNLSGSGSGKIKLFGRELSNASFKLSNGNLNVSGGLGIKVLGYNIGLDVDVTLGTSSQEIEMTFDFLGHEYTLLSFDLDYFVNRFTSTGSLVSLAEDIIWDIVGNIAALVEDLFNTGVEFLSSIGSAVIDIASDLYDGFVSLFDNTGDPIIHPNEPHEYEVTDTSEHIIGNDNKDLIYGNGGNDTLEGRLRPDLLDGGSGNDRILGGNDNDTIIGGDGNDTVFAQGDHDLVYGWAGNDLLIGNGDSGRQNDSNDHDTMYGGLGNDELQGRGGNDYLYGNAGNDRISGGDGNDVIDPGVGNDYIDGGSGSDTVRFEGNKSDYTQTKTSNGWKITHKKSGDVTTVVNVESFKFGSPSNAVTSAISQVTRYFKNSNIENAEVFFDANLNGVRDPNEPFAITEADGSFNLEINLEEYDLNYNGVIDPTEGLIIGQGGTYVSSGLPVETSMSAIPGSEMITPLTTLTAELVMQEAEPEAAETQVKSALGLPEDIDLGTFNYLDAAADGDLNGLKVYSAVVQVQNTIVTATKLLEGAAPETAVPVANAAIEAIASQIQNSQSLDLSQSETLQAILNSTISTVSQLDTEIDTTQLSQVSAIAVETMAQSNQLIQDTAESEGALNELATNITRIQKVALGDVAESLSQLAAGTKTVEEFAAETTPEAIQAKLAETVVSDPTFRPEVVDDASEENINIVEEAEASSSDEDIVEVESSTDNTSGSNNTGSSNEQFIGSVIGSGSGSASETNDFDFSNSIPQIISPVQPQMADMTANTSEATDGSDMMMGNGVEPMYLLDGHDTLMADDGDNWVNGNQGNDMMEVRAGNDTVYGGQDNDTVFGSAGNDWINGNLGQDFLNGGEDADTLFGGQNGDILQGGSGNDELFGNAGDDRMEGNDGNDLLHGGKGNDTGSGGLGDDTIYGDTGDDLIDGNAGNDLLNGGQGNDTLDGGSGNDELIGDVGDDLLFGAGGADTLTGGAGQDQFVLTPTSGSDLITDFTDGEDLIVLDGLTFDQLTIDLSQNATFVKLGDQVLATLNGVESSLITADDFTSLV